MEDKFGDCRWVIQIQPWQMSRRFKNFIAGNRNNIGIVRVKQLFTQAGPMQFNFGKTFMTKTFDQNQIDTCLWKFRKLIPQTDVSPRIKFSD